MNTATVYSWCVRAFVRACVRVSICVCGGVSHCTPDGDLWADALACTMHTITDIASAGQDRTNGHEKLKNVTYLISLLMNCEL